MKRILLVGLLVMAAGAPVAAHADDVCAGGSVTGPLIGTVSAYPCVPTPEPNRTIVHSCTTLQQQGVQVCETVQIPHP